MKSTSKSPTRVKVWVTQYAFTRGVFSVQVELREEYPYLAVRPASPEEGPPRYFHKPYWHLSEKEATAHVVKMAGDKLASLRKQMAKVTNIMNKAKAT